MKLTVRDAAKLLHTSEQAVQRWIRDKSIPYQKVNDDYRFNRSELLEWATSRGIRIAPHELHDGGAEGTAALTLAQALEAGGVHARVPGKDRESVLRSVVERMPIDAADREMLFDFLLAREALGSTGVGDGIAIPHVRNPIVLGVDRASVTLCFLESPVDFEAIDGKPVDVIFSVVSPTIREHLFLLSRIAAALHDKAFKKAILDRAPPEKILREAQRVEEALVAAKGARSP
jgi:PTS system nitrogen regulatory IIA component